MIPEKYAKYEKYATIAGVNWHGIWGDKQANLEKMKTTCRQAREMGVDIIAFPEMSLTGYECGAEARETEKPCSMHSEAAELIPGPTTEEMVGLAKELDMYIIFGMPEKDPEDQNVMYISAAAVGPEGVLGSYRKMHLATPPVWTEYYCFKPGNILPVFETRFGPIGVQICADFWVYPELTRIQMLRGARIIFNIVGSALSPGKLDMIKGETICRAQSTQVYIVTCNHVGSERTLSYYGHTTIGAPGFPKFYKCLATSESMEEIVWATVSFETLHFSRGIFRIEEAGNWGLISEGYKEIAGTSK
ncbi:MAG: carbon-nitrogen hydrolase family protein [SAR202 cluster bacterium]|jgi:predicted amidohydrolase|nr:carbon-nitrogen hydrolase family protein [SAR202 cluster bacterium]